MKLNNLFENMKLNNLFENFSSQLHKADSDSSDAETELSAKETERYNQQLFSNMKDVFAYMESIKQGKNDKIQFSNGSHISLLSDFLYIEKHNVHGPLMIISIGNILKYNKISQIIFNDSFKYFLDKPKNKLLYVSAKILPRLKKSKYKVMTTKREDADMFIYILPVKKAIEEIMEILATPTVK